MKTRKTPTESSYWACSWCWLAIFVAALVLFGFTVWQVYEHTLKGWEFTVLAWVNHWPDSLRTGFLLLTMLGSVWAAAVLVMAAFAFRLYQLAWRLALSILTVYGLALIMKQFLERPQPGMLGVDVHARLVEVGPSFPSVHVAVAAVLALTVFTYLPKWWRWPVVLLWIGSVVIARLYLGVSAPLDVLGGLALGVGVVCFWELVPAFARKFLRLK